MRYILFKFKIDNKLFSRTLTKDDDLITHAKLCKSYKRFGYLVLFVTQRWQVCIHCVL